ncbi:glutathione S-transferase [Chytriomyces cf. hyalinus JEL632]|nr:glutathione S-transferase [Chytriomyces cf. hyalinus JEL632]
MPFATKRATTKTTTRTAADGTVTTTIETTTASTPKPFDITLYLAGTPNGKKASIALEELSQAYGITYNVRSIDFSKVEQKEEWFLKINPNGRIPAIVDHARGDFAVFESGAILLYLAEHYDPEGVLLSKDADERSTAVQWVMWQMGGLGPMQGQAGHFNGAAEKIPYAIGRYTDETKRLYSVMERAFSDGREYLAGNKYSIADISSFTWTAYHQFSLGKDFTLEEYPLVNKWLHKVALRSAVVAGMNVPTKIALLENDFKA